jgi:hypothetical protein
MLQNELRKRYYIFIVYMSDDGSVGSTGTEIYFEGNQPLFTNQPLFERRQQLELQAHYNPLSDRERREYRRIERAILENYVRMTDLRARHEQQQQLAQQEPSPPPTPPPQPQPQPQPTVRTYLRRLVNSLTARNQNATIAPR